MRSSIALSLVVAVIAACGDHREPPPNHAADPAEASCKQRAADLTSYLIQVFDSNAKPPPPWPTGDAATDHTVDMARDALRKAMTATSADKARPLRGHPEPGPVDETLAGCPQARDAWAHVSRFPEPDHLTKAAVAIGDGVAACSCHINIPLIRAALYLMVRGPD
jgi:hypothetical protein